MILPFCDIILSVSIKFRFLHLLAIMLVASCACRAAVTVNAVADTLVTTGPTSNLTGNNYGAAGGLGVSAALANGTFSSIVRFDVSTAVAAFDTQFGAGNWTLSGVQLSLASTAPNNAMFNSPNTGGLFGVSWFSNDAWTEGTGTPTAPTTTGVTWNDIAGLTASAESQGTFSYNPAASGLVSYNLSASSGLSSDVMGGGLVSFYLTAADSSVSALFASRTNPTTGNRPTLTLTALAVPEPGRAVLLLFGVTALISRRHQFV